MYPWESKELVELNQIRSKIANIWNHTELNIEEVPAEFLRTELTQISSLVNDAILHIDTEIDRLIARDCDSKSTHTCSHCESDSIYVCEPCMVNWSDSIVIKEFK